MNKVLLKIVALFAPLWRGMGVDTGQMMAILEARLLMDGRRVSVFGQNRQTAEPKRQDLLGMAVFFFIGLFMLILFDAFRQPATALTVYFTIWMFMLAMTLISDFTEVLIDVRDNLIILPRPISDRTVAITRLLHIGIYLFKITLAYVIPALIFTSIAWWPLGGLVFILQVFLSEIIVIFFVNLTYLFILRITSPKRFREIISWFQIAFSVIVLSSYYLLPQILDFTELKKFDILDIPASYFLPSTWVASLWPIIGQGQWNANVLMLGALAFVTPLVAVFLISEVLAKHFNRKMMALAEGSSSEPEKENKAVVSAHKNYRALIAALVTRTPAERAGFEWAWAMTTRSRDYKLKSYPSMAFAVVLFFYYSLQGSGSLQDRWAEMSAGKWHVLLIYLCWMTLTTMLYNSVYTNKHKAAWIFHASPLKHPGPLFSGTFLAILTGYYTPFFLVIGIGMMFIWGIGILPDLLLGYSNTVFLTLLGQLMSSKRLLPFSSNWTNQRKGTNLFIAMFSMLLVGIVGVLHYFIAGKIWITLPLAVIFGFGSWVLLRSYRQVKWQSVFSGG